MCGDEELSEASARYKNSPSLYSYLRQRLKGSLVVLIPTFSPHRRQHLPDSRHESLFADQLDVTTGVPLSLSSQLLEVHLGEQLHILRVQVVLEQLLTCLEVWERNEDSLL